MILNKDKFVAARKASNLSIESAAKLVNLSKQGYINHEKDPSMFRLSEIQRLYEGLNNIAKPILQDAVGDIFLDCELRSTQESSVT